MALANAGTEPTITMTVNGKTVGAVYEGGRVTYTPAADLTDGRTEVVVTAKRADGKEASYKIVGSQESDPMNGIISEESPFGKALVGAKEGDTVTVEAPSGAIVYTVQKIER